jgi:hypothetical protein
MKGSVMHSKMTFAVWIAAGALILSAGASHAQSRQRTAAAPPPERCLKALDGSCVKTEIVEATRQRAAIIPSVRVSYYGSPQGSIGSPFIPFERLFQDNPLLFGLPTYTCAACITFRTK